MYFWYKLLTYLFYPFAPFFLFLRKLKKKEHSIRYKEKLSQINAPRSEGFLIWFHVASVGEAMSILPLIENFEQDGKIKRILITSITVSSAEVLKKMLEIIKNDGMIVLTCPYFINLRGIVWMTLALGMNVPMSLTDKHFISPFDIRDWLLETDCKLLDTTYFDFDRANSQPMIIDMKKRLMNAFRDAELPNEGIPQLIDWLSKVVNEEQESLKSMNGSSALYIIGRKAIHD